MAGKNEEPVIAGSGNVFADIGLDRPEEVNGKARIVEAIADLLEQQGITQKKMGKLVSLTQPQVSRLMRGDTREFSYERLLRVLMALGQDVEITIRPSHDPKRRGHLFVYA